MQRPWVQEDRLRDGTRVYTTASSLDAPVAQIHCIFALPSALPEVAGEVPVLLEWMQRGTEAHSRSEIFDAFGALGIEPQLSMLPSGILFSMRCLDACREVALGLAQELLFRPAFEDGELEDVLVEMDQDDRASRDVAGQISYRAQRRARWHGTTLAAPVNGTKATRKKLDGAYLRGLHAQLFERPAILAIASEQSDAWIAALERTMLRDRPTRRWEYTPPTASYLHAQPRDIFVDAPALEHAVVSRYSPGPAGGDLATIARTFLHHEALTDGMSAPLMVQLRGEKSLSYSVFSMLIDRGDGWDQCFEIEPSAERVEEALAAGSALWVQEDALTAEDFRRARIALHTQERLQTIDAPRALAHSLRHEILWNRPMGSRQAQVQAILDANADNARTMGARYGMSQSPLCTVVVGRKADLPQKFQSEMLDLDALFDADF